MPRHGFDGFWFCYSLGRVPLMGTRAGFFRVYKCKYTSLHSEGNHFVAMQHCRIWRAKKRSCGEEAYAAELILGGSLA